MPVEETRRVMKISATRSASTARSARAKTATSATSSRTSAPKVPVRAATSEMLKTRIEQVLKTLTYREREIIKLRYGIGDGYTYTLEEVGRIFKVTRERVRQVEAIGT